MEILFEERPYRCIIISPHPQFARANAASPQGEEKEEEKYWTSYLHY